MDERSKRLKRKKKRARHEATKKRTRNHKMRESETARLKEFTTSGTTDMAKLHSDFMSKKRR